MKNCRSVVIMALALFPALVAQQLLSRTPRFCYETEIRPSRTIFSYVPNN